MQTIAEIIPGLNEAEGRFRDELMEAFVGLEPSICGTIDVLPFTPKMFIDLEAGGSNFFSKAPLTVTDIAVLLWRVNPGFDAGNKRLRRDLNLYVGMLPFEKAAMECIDYIRRAWAGMPQWKSKKTNKTPSMGVWPSRLVHMFASEYGWSEQTTLSTPFRRLWQYANRILEANDPDYTHKAPEVLRMRAEWLIKRREERARNPVPPRRRPTLKV